MATNKPKSQNHVLSAAQFRSARKLPLGDGFVLVKVGNSIDVAVRPSDEASQLVSKAGAALRTPGIRRDAVFRGATPQKVFAYSALPGDSRMLVREAQDGSKKVGTIGPDGKFRASRKPT